MIMFRLLIATAFSLTLATVLAIDGMDWSEPMKKKSMVRRQVSAMHHTAGSTEASTEIEGTGEISSVGAAENRNNDKSVSRRMMSIKPDGHTEHSTEHMFAASE